MGRKRVRALLLASGVGSYHGLFQTDEAADLEKGPLLLGVRMQHVQETYQEEKLREGLSQSGPYPRSFKLLTSPSSDVANAKAKPAIEASMRGERTATKAVIPMTALESRLNRADSQRLTIRKPLTSVLNHPP